MTQSPKAKYHNPSEDPTPEEIALACAEIRKGWSEITRQSRAVRGKTLNWEVQEFCASKVRGETVF
jgi:hypothetical protein